MKKLLGAVTGIILSLGCFAQVSIGIQGTGNLASAKVKFEDDFNYNKTMKAMPGGGIVAQFNINKNLAVRSGVNYVQNGLVLKAELGGETSTKVKLENNLHYIQVPVNLLFQALNSLRAAEHFSIMASAVNRKLRLPIPCPMASNLPNLKRPMLSKKQKMAAPA